MSLRVIIAALVVALLLPGPAAAATLLIADDFEDGTLNKWFNPVNIVNFNASPAAFSGSRVARGCWGDYYNIFLRSYNVAYPELYLRYWIKYEPGFDWASENNQNNKHVRIRTAAESNGFFFSLFRPGGTGGRLWFYDGNTINSHEPIPDGYGVGFTPQAGRWYLYEFYWKLNTGGAANGSAWVKVDGVTMLSASGVKFRTGDNVFFQEMIFVGNNHGTSSAGKDCVQLDDVQIWNGLPGGPAPTATAPAAPATIAPAPSVTAPTVTFPSVTAPTTPAPTVTAPTVPAPTTPAPAVTSPSPTPQPTAPAPRPLAAPAPSVTTPSVTAPSVTTPSAPAPSAVSPAATGQPGAPARRPLGAPAPSVTAPAVTAPSGIAPSTTAPTVTSPGVTTPTTAAPSVTGEAGPGASGPGASERGSSGSATGAKESGSGGTATGAKE